MTDWGSRYGSGGSTSGGGTSWGSRYGSGGSTSSGSSGGGSSSGGWIDDIGGAIGGALGHIPGEHYAANRLGAAAGVGGAFYHQGLDVIHGIPNLTHLPGMAWHDIKSPNNVSLIDLIGDRSKGFRNISRQLHDPKGLIGSTYMPFESDVSHARHGDLHYFATHPLNPILDIAAAFSVGGAGALKLATAGKLGARYGELATGERALTHIDEAGDEFKVKLGQARTLQGRIRQQAFDRYSAANPDKRIVGLHARTRLILNTRAASSMLRARVPARQFQRLTQKLTPSERFAFHVFAEDVPLDQRIAYYRAQLQIKPTKLVRGYLKQLESDGVRAAIENPRPELLDALWKGRDLEAAAGERLVQAGAVSPESRTERAALPREMMGSEAPGAVNSVHPDAPPAFRFWHTGGSGKTLEGTLSNPGTERMLGKQAVLDQTKRSLGVRLERAAFQTDPERVLMTDYLSTMRHELILGMQKEALLPISQALSAELIDHGFKGENEWYFRPSFDRKTTAPVDRATREAENLTRDRQPLDQQLHEAELKKTSEGIVSQKLSDLGIDAKDAKNLDKLNQLGVRRVPAAYGKDFVREFHGTPAFLRYFVDRPLDVWRAITLNFRPAWAVNNLVGNSVMGLAAHPGSALWYLRTLRAEVGLKPIKQIRNWTLKRPTLRRKYAAIFDEVAPELHSAGLFGTQTKVTAGGIHEGSFRANPAVRTLGFVPKKVGQGVMAVGRGITKAEVLLAEDTGREAVFLSAAGADLAKVRAAAKAMGEGNLNLAEALRRLDKDSVEKAVRSVNDALGDFNDLNHTERAALRRLVPFYSWYKVITKVSGKYAARYPARLLLLKNIADARDKKGEPALPSWLGGSVLLGTPKNGTQSLISTTGINPYETIPQTLEGGPVGLLNPAFGAFVVGAAGRNATFGNLQDYYGPGATSRGGFPGFAERTIGAGVGSLAPIRLAIGESTPYPGRLYDPTTYKRNLLLQYLGIPLRDVKLQEAKRERGL